MESVRKLWAVEFFEDNQWIASGIVYAAQAPAERFAENWSQFHKKKTRVTCYVPINADNEHVE